MHPFFQPLSDREAMILLTTLTVGGSEAISIFAHLPSDAAARLQDKAQALLEIPSDKRVPFMVKEMKQAISDKGLRGVERVDPSWILQSMRGENPRVVASILVSLSPSTVRSVLRRLPSGVRRHLPPKDDFAKAPPELIRAVRQIFEARFHRMPMASGKSFSFRDIIHLERKALYRVMRDLGLIELGQAFVAVGKLALAELCRRLPRSKAEELILAVRKAAQVEPPDLKTAQRFLSRVVVNFDDADEFFQKAGLWRIAKACLLEDEAFHAAFKQRMPREAGELFMEYLEKAREMEDFTEDSLKRLQDMIMLRVVELSRIGAVGSRWSEMEILLHHPELLQALQVSEPRIANVAQEIQETADDDDAASNG
ncbi:MAG: hypothetical protein R3C68_14400 [Myxococcota bacterium]